MKDNHQAAWSIVAAAILLQVCCFVSCGAYIDKQPHRGPASYRQCDGQIFRRPVYQYDAPARTVQKDREA